MNRKIKKDIKGKRNKLIMSALLLLVSIILIPITHATYVNININTYNVCLYHQINANVFLYYPYQAERAVLLVYIDGRYKETLNISTGTYTIPIHIDNIESGSHLLMIHYYIYNRQNDEEYIVSQGYAYSPFHINCNIYENTAQSTNQNTPSTISNILLYSDHHNICVNEGVRIYGYVSGENINTPYLHLYLNNNPLGAVQPNNRGYFERYIFITKEGINHISISGGEITKTIEINATPCNNNENTQETTQTITQNLNGPHTSEDNQNSDTVRIVVNGSTIRVYLPNSQNSQNNTQNNKNKIKYQYVDVQVSTKELDMQEGVGNAIKVLIYNHMNESKLFSVNTSLDNKYVYLPSPQVLNVGEKDEFTIYLKPRFKEINTTDNTINAKIFVYMNHKKIKEIPIQIFIIKRKYTEKEATPNTLSKNKTILNITYIQYIFGGVLAAGILLILYLYINQKTSQNKEEILRPKYYINS